MLTGLGKLLFKSSSLIYFLCWFSIGYNSVREKIKMSVSKVSETEYNKMQHDVFALQKAGK